MALALWQMQLIAEQEERNILKIRRRQLCDASNPFEILELQFLFLYRFSKVATLELCNAIRPYVQEGMRATAIPLELKLLATLSLLSSGSYQRRIDQDFLSCMCQASVSRAIHEIVNALNAIMPQWIKFPTQNDEIQFVQQQYVVSDYYCKILAVVANHSGRTHNARVWSSSRLWRHILNQYENGRRNMWLLDKKVRFWIPIVAIPHDAKIKSATRVPKCCIYGESCENTMLCRKDNRDFKRKMEKFA